MTGYGELTEDKEKKRLESILKQSEQTWKRGIGNDVNSSIHDNDDDMDDDDHLLVGKKKNAKKNDNSSSLGDNKNDEQHQQDDLLSLLSPELREQFSEMGTDNLLILPSSKKSKANKPKTPSLPPLTPHEIKAAKTLYKNTQRKLQQLEQRKKQKETRNGLYRQLEENTLIQSALATEGGNDADAPANSATNPNATKSNTASTTTLPHHGISAQDAQSLLLKSSELGKKVTKKQRLKQLRRKEALGLELTKEEMDLLYVKCEVPSADSFPTAAGGNMNGGQGDATAAKNHGEITNNKSAKDDGMEVSEDAISGKKGKKKNKKKRSKNSIPDCDDDDEKDNTNVSGGVGGLGTNNEKDDKQNEKKVEPLSKKARQEAESQQSIDKTSPSTDSATNNAEETKPKPSSFAQMMFASLTTLKTKTDVQNVELASEKAQKQQQEEEVALKLEEEERKRRKVYVPSETVTAVSTMRGKSDDTTTASGGDSSAGNTTPSSNGNAITKKRSVVQQIDRPAAIEESRYDLPVSAMEYEIIDAVRTNDCTILCGETGSGKSTQVPQFLYESGFSTSDWWKNGVDSSGSDKGGNNTNNLLIGITQPRRVAAVSTAKRVCYEMGQGDGQTIRSSNLVAYQTRYETAGLSSSTRIKFMTDGILLQEIQSDLLLRKYGAIVIDEAHERNLNTDVLLGLLSVALPLRRKAAAEGSLPPLKLVVMSATLRVEDFTQNKRLFPRDSPAVVMVPGRTHPVSIHHSKVTELDDYGELIPAFVCAKGLYFVSTSFMANY